MGRTDVETLLSNWLAGTRSEIETKVEEFPFGPPCCGAPTPLQVAFTFTLDDLSCRTSYSCAACGAILSVERHAGTGNVVWKGRRRANFECTDSVISGQHTCRHKGRLFHERGPEFVYDKRNLPGARLKPDVFLFPFGPPCCHSKAPVSVSTQDSAWRLHDAETLIRPYLCQECNAPRWSITWGIERPRNDTTWTVRGSPEWWHEFEVTSGYARLFSYSYVFDCGRCGAKLSAFLSNTNVGSSHPSVRCKSCGEAWDIVREGADIP